MSARLQQIEAEALRLPPEERESLAGVLVQSLEDASVNEIDAASRCSHDKDLPQ